MKRGILAAIIAGTLGAATLASGEPLDRKQAGALKRIATSITNNETSLTSYGPGARWGLISDRVLADFTRKITAIEAKLAELPSDHEDVKAELAHLAKLKAALAEQAAARASATKAVSDAKAEVVALVSAPAFDADLKQLTAMVAMFERASTYALGHYHFGRWVEHEDHAEMRQWGERWAKTQTEFVALRARYTKAIESKLGNGPADFKVIKLKEVADNDAVKKFETFRASVDAFVKGAPAAVEADGKELLALIDKAAATSEFAQILDPDGRIQTLRHRLVNLVSAFAPLAPSPAERAKVEEVARSAEANAAAAIARLAEKIIATNQAPEDTYAGQERAAIVAYITKVWKTKFPQEAVLAIRLRAPDFERRTAWVGNPNTNELVKTDVSRLRVTVIVKGSGNEAVLWSAMVLRDHMAGATFQLDWIDRSSKGPTPLQRMLQTNLK